jgi:hypothetical protein
VPETNGIAVRIENLERAVHRLERLEPAVVKQQVQDIREDIREIHDDLSAVKRILIGFLVTFAFAGVSTTVAIVMLVQGGA